MPERTNICRPSEADMNAAIQRLELGLGRGGPVLMYEELFDLREIIATGDRPAMVSEETLQQMIVRIDARLDAFETAAPAVEKRAPEQQFGIASFVGLAVVLGLLGLVVWFFVWLFSGDDDDTSDRSANGSSSLEQQAPRDVTASAQDAAFISALDQAGIWYPSPSAVITVAHAVCADLDSGAYTPLDLGVTVMNGGTYSAAEAGTFVGAAIGAYCPEHR